MALALIVALVPLHRLWTAQVLLVPLLLIVPGSILLRALRIPSSAVGSFPIYVPCASVAVLFASGLAIDLIGPLIGIATPLRTGPLLASLGIICLALLAGSVNAPPDVGIPWRAPRQPVRHVWPLIVPAVAAIGALRLNSGHGDRVAVVALVACLVMLVTVLAFLPRIDTTMLAIVVYAADLALMWAYSLRGGLVYGFDINTEYYDLQQTVQGGIWHLDHSGDAYGAMLSVTIMPTELHFLSGVSALLVFKLVYPMISALFPVAVFYVARRLLSNGWAFIAAGFFVAEGTFAQELPGIARQEIALVLFVGLFAAILDAGIPRRSHWALVALLAVAMALAHYSTTYVAITLIGLALPLQWLASWLRAVPRVTGAFAVAFIASLAGAIVWYGPVTHSTASGLQQLGQSVESQGLSLLPNRVDGQSLIASYLQGNTATPITARQYQRSVHEYYAAHIPYVTPLPDAILPQYSLRTSAPPVPAVKWIAGYSALGFGSLIVEQLVNVLGAVGALLMVLRRKASLVTRQVALLAVAAVLFLGMIRLSGTLAVAYNQERALLQATAILAITLSWLIQSIANRWSGGRALVVAVAAASLAVMFVSTTGLMGAVLGGATDTNLANSGEDFERFYVTTPELAAAQWLDKAKRPGQLVYADRYAELPLVAMTGIGQGLVGDITPLTINQHGWVYADRTNVVDGRARTVFENHSVIYAFPFAFLNTNYDLVYTNGSSRVYHR